MFEENRKSKLLKQQNCKNDALRISFVKYDVRNTVNKPGISLMKSVDSLSGLKGLV